MRRQGAMFLNSIEEDQQALESLEELYTVTHMGLDHAQSFSHNGELCRYRKRRHHAYGIGLALNAEVRPEL